MRPAPTALTDEQRRYAAENHGLIYRFLREKGWSADEYYDVVALGYLAAVMQYLSNPKLHSYAFSTIAWRKMKQSVANQQRAEARRRSHETAYAEQAAETGKDPFEERIGNAGNGILVVQTGGDGIYGYHNEKRES